MNPKLFSSILMVFLVKLFTSGLSMQVDLYGNTHIYEGSDCKLENGAAGVCKKIQECPSRVREVIEGKRSSDSMGRCGFEDFTEIVCCQLNITEKIGLRPAETACRQYENEIETQEARNQDIEVQFNIFAGLPAEHGEFPYMVALGYENQDMDDNNSVSIKYNCGGTLISSQHVLTAAHCVNNIQKLIPTEIRIGSVDLRSVEDGEQRVPISDVITHPRYRRSQNYHDVAILKLRRPVSLTGTNVRPICIQTKSLDTMEIPQTTEFIVIGWGATSFDKTSSTKLMRTPSLSMVDRASCAKSFTGFSKLPHGLDENMLCVIDTNTTRRSDACQGDSGGPLLMLTGPNHSIVGITAFGQTCGGSIPGVYTAVFSYLEWIEEQVWPETD